MWQLFPDFEWSLSRFPDLNFSGFSLLLHLGSVISISIPKLNNILILIEKKDGIAFILGWADTNSWSSALHIKPPVLSPLELCEQLSTSHRSKPKLSSPQFRLRRNSGSSCLLLVLMPVLVKGNWWLTTNTYPEAGFVSLRAPGCSCPTSRCAGSFLSLTRTRDLPISPSTHPHPWPQHIGWPGPGARQPLTGQVLLSPVLFLAVPLSLGSPNL